MRYIENFEVKLILKGEFLFPHPFKNYPADLESLPIIPPSTTKGILRYTAEKYIKGYKDICNCGKCEVCQIWGFMKNDRKNKEKIDLEPRLRVLEGIFIDKEEIFRIRNKIDRIEQKAIVAFEELSLKGKAVIPIIYRILFHNKEDLLKELRLFAFFLKTIFVFQKSKIGMGNNKSIRGIELKEVEIKDPLGNIYRIENTENALEYKKVLDKLKENVEKYYKKAKKEYEEIIF